MPIYEYRRPDGSTFEVLQPFTDAPLQRDPETGVPVERVLHAPAVHFKGKGFYNTDYGTRKRQRETPAADGDASSGEASGSSGEASRSSDGAGAGSGTASGDSAGAGGNGSAPAGRGRRDAAGTQKAAAGSAG